MALGSEFKLNDKLNRCLVNDSDHIGLLTLPPADRRGPHVSLIQKALNAFARRMGFDLIQETGVYDQITADLVTTFKELHKPHPILNFKNQIDSIVGKKTVDALDKELPLLGAEPIKPPREIADIIVRYIGTRPEVGNLRIKDPQEVLPDSRIEPYLKNHKTDRTLFRMGSRTVSIGPDAREIISEDVRRTREIAVDMDIGKIFIFGSSSEGRNALDLAARLQSEFPLAYVGVADPAFFPSDTTDKPTRNVDPPDVVPTFRMFAGIRADKKENFFQTNGNHTRREKSTFLQTIVFTSDLKDEIHGQLTGFEQKPFNLFGKDDGDRHSRLIGIANDFIRRTISASLNEIPVPQPVPEPVFPR